ncbi:LacI family DNA-binding transcriptional regulator [Marinactinospora rubrisoli]|uniref:LacI family DNA-binding transcriptional regulator n=1 Tax=Marinactinospora rubrisoli TaxID=2715399 RepID=A0ABW2KA88_9ACTN
MTVTLTDVAKSAGVALSTASRAFTDPERLAPATLRKVLSVAQELGYRSPASTGGGRPIDDGITVAVVVPDIANPVFGAFIKAAQGQGWHRRQTVVVADTDGGAEREHDVIEHLRTRVDGIVVCSPRQHAEQVLELCGPVPVVLVNRELPGGDCVLNDASDGLRQTLDHLEALGHRRLAYVQGSPRSWSNQHRVEVISALTAERGLDLTVLGSQAETVDGGVASAASVAASGATAVVAHNDLVALGIIRGARALGLDVPADLSVVGIDDVPVAGIGSPPLTSIRTQMARAGALSLDLVHRALSGERRTPRTVRLATQLVVRGSTGRVRAPDGARPVIPTP